MTEKQQEFKKQSPDGDEEPTAKGTVVTSTAVERFERRSPGVPAVQADSPNAVIIMAMQNNYTPELIEKMMDLQERNEATESRKAFHKAFAEFRKNPPEILKTKTVTYSTSKGQVSYSHAELGEICEAIGERMGEYGLYAKWDQKRVEGGIEVPCIITHKDGHSEMYGPIFGAADNSGSKNAIQATNSTNTYLQRISLLGATGLAAKGGDDDAQSAEPPEHINTDQCKIINDLLKETDSNLKVFLKVAKAESVQTILQSAYPMLIKKLNKKKADLRQLGE